MAVLGWGWLCLGRDGNALVGMAIFRWGWQCLGDDDSVPRVMTVDSMSHCHGLLQMP